MRRKGKLQDQLIWLRPLNPDHGHLRQYLQHSKRSTLGTDPGRAHCHNSIISRKCGSRSPVRRAIHQQNQFLAIIDPYLTNINLTNLEGIKTYKKMIKLDNACIRQHVSVKTATHMMDIFKDKEIQYGLDDIFIVLKYGTGVAEEERHCCGNK